MNEEVDDKFRLVERIHWLISLIERGEDWMREEWNNYYGSTLMSCLSYLLTDLFLQKLSPQTWPALIRIKTS